MRDEMRRVKAIEDSEDTFESNETDTNEPIMKQNETNENYVGGGTAT